MMTRLTRRQLWRKRHLPPKIEIPDGYMISPNPFWKELVKADDVRRANKDLMDQFDSLSKHARDFENYRP